MHESGADPAWFLPVSGELRLGGRYQLEGNAGAEPNGTRFELEYVAHVDDTKSAEFGPGAVGVGWDLTLVGLALHLGSAEGFDPAAGMAWMGTDAERRFMTESSERWYEASVAAGPIRT